MLVIAFVYIIVVGIFDNEIAPSTSPDTIMDTPQVHTILVKQLSQMSQRPMKCHSF